MRAVEPPVSLNSRPALLAVGVTAAGGMFCSGSPAGARREPACSPTACTAQETAPRRAPASERGVDSSMRSATADARS